MPGLDFGLVDIDADTNATGLLTLTNLGGASLDSVTATIDGGPFALLSTPPFALPGFGSTNVLFSFTPSQAGSFSNLVRFASNSGNITNTLLGSAAFEPVAAFTGNPTTGLKPLTVIFTDASQGTITNWTWFFGDGTFVSTILSTVAHTYTNAGSYSVSLNVSGPLGNSSALIFNYISATNPPPKPFITSLEVSGVNVLVSFASVAGQSYRLEYSDDLSLSSWSTAVDAIAGTGGIISVTHTGGATQPFRFYRIRQL